MNKEYTTHELIKYAEELDPSPVMFAMYIDKKYVVSGKFLDVYFGFVLIPVLGNGFVNIDDIREQYGDKKLSFKIINEDMFNTYVTMDFINRGKYNEIPKEYSVGLEKSE